MLKQYLCEADDQSRDFFLNQHKIIIEIQMQNMLIYIYRERERVV